MSTATTQLESMHATDLLDHEALTGLGMDGPHSVPPSPWNRPAETERSERPTAESRALSRLLAMADAYLRSNELHQALEMYFDLMTSYPDTFEAGQAEERLLEVARRHERSGELRMARAIYERLV